MILIQQKRIRNIDRYIPAELRGKKLRAGGVVDSANAKRLQRIGLGSAPKTGETILPAIVGPVSRFNAEGRQLVRRDLPMETAYRQVMWRWYEWHGRDKVEQTGIKDVPYPRYPREFIPPPSLELEVRETDAGQKVVVTPVIAFDDKNESRLLHAINLILEIFGECQVLTEDLKATSPTQVKRLNWRILPPGRYPWDKLRQELEPIIEQARKGNRPVISYRLETVAKYSPEFVAVGEGGFSGYVVFGFPSKNRYIFESSLYGNATYVFDKDWEDLSKWTKADILNQNRQRGRIIHLASWESNLQKQLV